MILFLAVAVFTDLYRNKIYNAWVIPGMAGGLSLSMLQGMPRFMESISAMGAALLILLPVYFLRGIAAGDVKLMCAASAFLTMQDALSCILISFLTAGVISLAVLIFTRNRQKTIHFAVPVLASALFVAGGVL